MCPQLRYFLSLASPSQSGGRSVYVLSALLLATAAALAGALRRNAALQVGGGDVVAARPGFCHQNVFPCLDAVPVFSAFNPETETLKYISNIH